MSERNPVVAGQFYEGTGPGLKAQIEKSFRHKIGTGKLPEVNVKGERKIIGLVSPHAGYMYSGPVAGHGFNALARDGIPETIILLGPNHQGIGSPVALSIADTWKTPLGRVRVDKETGEAIVNACSVVELDENAHRFEHSLEVQIPFLQYLYQDKFSIVAISMLDQDIEICRALGKSIADAVKEKNIVIIASTDLTHYEPGEEAARKDKLVLDCILRLDPQGMLGVVQEFEISMCGPGPVATMLFAAKELGAKESVLLKYANSGDTGGDYRAVVGYASLLIRK